MKISHIFFITFLFVFALVVQAEQCINGLNWDFYHNGTVSVKGLNLDPNHSTQFSSVTQANQTISVLKKLGFSYSQCQALVKDRVIDPSKIILTFQGLTEYNPNAYTGQEDNINVFVETYYYDAPGSAVLAGSAWPYTRGQRMQVWFEYWAQDNPDIVWKTVKQDRTGSGSFTQNIFLFQDSVHCFRAKAQKYDGINALGDEYISNQEMCFAPPQKLPPTVVSESGKLDAGLNTAYFQASVWAKAGETNYQVWFEYWEEGNKDNTLIETPHFTKNGNGYFDATVIVDGNKKYCFQPFALKTAGSYAGYGPERCFSDKSWQIAPVVGTDKFNYTYINNDKKLKVVLSGKIYKADTPNDLFKGWFLLYPKGKPNSPIGASNGAVKKDVFVNNIFTFQYEVEAGKTYCFVPYAQRALGGQLGYGREICFPEETPAVVTEGYDYAASFKRAVIKAYVGGGSDKEEYVYYFKYYPYGKESQAISTKQKTKRGNGIVAETLENIPNNQVYCFLPFARNKSGYAWAKGAQLCFPLIPIVVTKDPTNITATEATLKGQAFNQYNAAGSYYTQFQWWEKGSYTRKLTDVVSWGKSQSQAELSAVVKLAAGKEYCYRAVVRINYNNKAYENYGKTKCFKTKAFDPSVCSSETISSNPSVKQVLDVIRFINSQTSKKVRESLTFAMLVQESSMGRNPGGCCYQETSYCCYAYPTLEEFNSKNQKQNFIDICNTLGLDWMTRKVSCPFYPPGEGCTNHQYNGGAMGIAQFMPNTWLGHVDDIKTITKHDHFPSPWNLCDSISANISKLYWNGAREDGRGEAGAINAYNPGNNLYFFQVTNRRCWCEKYIANLTSQSLYDECFAAPANVKECTP